MREDQVIVRRATSDDSESVAILLTELGAPGVDSNEAARRLRQREEHVLLGCVNREVGGLLAIKKVIYFGHAEPLAHISALVVGTRYRRQGVAERLIHASRDWALEQHCAGLELMCGLNDTREEAHRFYPAMGFDANAYRYWTEV